MSLSSLEAFLERARVDQGLQEQLLAAPDAAALAAIAQAAGFAVREADWLLASEVSHGEMAALHAPDPPAADPLHAFLHQAQGDAALQQALAQAPDAAAVAAIARAAGYPITAADLWSAGGAVPGELAPLPAAAPGAEQDPAAAAGGEVLERFLRQLEIDPELQEALAEAADAAAVAAIAQAAGHPLEELDLWLASGLDPDELPPDPGLGPDPSGLEALTGLLHQAQGDPALQQALADAADAAAVAAIARSAGYPLTAAQLWAASGAVPEELTVPVLVVAGIGELPN